jgi:hypothetical protein
MIVLTALIISDLGPHRKPLPSPGSGHAPRVCHEEPKHLLLVEGQGMRQASKKWAET